MGLPRTVFISIVFVVIFHRSECFGSYKVRACALELAMEVQVTELADII